MSETKVANNQGWNRQNKEIECTCKDEASENEHQKKQFKMSAPVLRDPTIFTINMFVLIIKLRQNVIKTNRFEMHHILYC